MNGIGFARGQGLNPSGTPRFGSDTVFIDREGDDGDAYVPVWDSKGNVRYETRRVWVDRGCRNSAINRDSEVRRGETLDALDRLAAGIDRDLRQRRGISDPTEPLGNPRTDADGYVRNEVLADLLLGEPPDDLVVWTFRDDLKRIIDDLPHFEGRCPAHVLARVESAGAAIVEAAIDYEIRLGRHLIDRQADLSAVPLSVAALVSLT